MYFCRRLLKEGVSFSNIKQARLFCFAVECVTLCCKPKTRMLVQPSHLLPDVNLFFLVLILLYSLIPFPLNDFFIYLFFFTVFLFHLPPTVKAINSNTDSSTLKNNIRKSRPCSAAQSPAASPGPVRSSHHSYPVSESAAWVCQYIFQCGSTGHQSLSLWYKSAFSAVINSVSEFFLSFFLLPIPPFHHSRAVWPNCFSPHTSYSGRSTECISSPLLLEIKRIQKE